VGKTASCVFLEQGEVWPPII